MAPCQPTNPLQLFNFQLLPSNSWSYYLAGGKAIVSSQRYCLTGAPGSPIRGECKGIIMTII